MPDSHSHTLLLTRPKTNRQTKLFSKDYNLYFKFYHIKAGTILSFVPVLFQSGEVTVPYVRTPGRPALTELHLWGRPPDPPGAPFNRVSEKRTFTLR